MECTILRISRLQTDTVPVFYNFVSEFALYIQDSANSETKLQGREQGTRDKRIRPQSPVPCPAFVWKTKKPGNGAKMPPCII
jgi:hypothetical protein